MIFHVHVIQKYQINKSIVDIAGILFREEHWVAMKVFVGY